MSSAFIIYSLIFESTTSTCGLAQYCFYNNMNETFHEDNQWGRYTQFVERTTNRQCVDLTQSNLRQKAVISPIFQGIIFNLADYQYFLKIVYQQL